MDAKIKQLVKPLDETFAKLPALPKGAADFIVSVAPWLALVFGVLAILSGLAALLSALRGESYLHDVEVLKDTTDTLKRKKN